MRARGSTGRTTERGQTGIEYLGLITAVSLLIGAIVTVSVAANLNGGFEEALCRLMQVAGGGGSCDSDNVAEEAQGSPETQAPDAGDEGAQAPGSRSPAGM
ncbi:hypothetical protein ACFQ2K_10275 [Streptomyces sanglieri]|uniref:Flp family type IVb pilin n=1 Tax=Streptomyces sanglieri TaxID=193460 RepID=A0ABW2WTP4_9ACTN